MPIYGSYDLTDYWISETVFNTIPTTPAWKWTGTVQEAVPNNDPHALKIFAINNTRTLSQLIYSKKLYTYTMTYYPLDEGIFGTAFIPNNANANSISLEEAWKPLYGSGGDARYVRFSGGKTNKVQVKYKIGEPLEVKQDFVFANEPSGNPYQSPIAGASYASEPVTRPFMYSDQSVTMNGTQIFPFELEFDYDNKLQYDPHGYYIGSDKLRAIPPGRNPISGSVTANWEDWTRLTDVLTENSNTLVFPFGPTGTITMAYTKWDNLEMQMQLTKDVVAPTVKFTAKTAVLA